MFKESMLETSVLGQEAGNNSFESAELSEGEFINKTEKIKEELSNYISSVEGFQKSENATEVSKNATEIDRALSFANLPSLSKSLEKNLEAYKETDLDYDEEKIKEMVLLSYNQQMENGKDALKELFPDIPPEEMNQDMAKKIMKEYLDPLGINVEFEPKIRTEIAGTRYPVRLSTWEDEIGMEYANGGEIDMLDKMYELILEKFLSSLPENSVLVYPAIGDDLIFCETAKKYGHRTIGIDNNENVKIPKEFLIQETFGNYKELEERLIKEDLIKKEDNLILIFKGFDTLNEVTQEDIDKIIKDFDGNQIVLFGCEQSGSFGMGVPSTEGHAFDNLKDSPVYKDCTDKYFTEESRKAMEEVNDLSKKLEWTTGFFPATDIKIYSRK